MGSRNVSSAGFQKKIKYIFYPDSVQANIQQRVQAACEQAELRPRSLTENPPVTEMHLTLLRVEPEVFIPSSSFPSHLPERDPAGALGSQQHSAGFRRCQGKGSRRAAPQLRSSASPQTAVTLHKSVCLCFSI